MKDTPIKIHEKFSLFLTYLFSYPIIRFSETCIGNSVRVNKLVKSLLTSVLKINETLTHCKQATTNENSLRCPNS